MCVFLVPSVLGRFFVELGERFGWDILGAYSVDSVEFFGWMFCFPVELAHCLMGFFGGIDWFASDWFTSCGA